MYILELVGHIVTPGNVVCTTSLQTPAYNLVQLSFVYYSIPLLFSGLADALSFLYAFEFICCQAPTNMSGMLIGIFWFLRALYLNIGFFFTLWNKGGPGKIPCSFWVLVFQAIMCVLGLIVYIFIARWYQKRRKDEDYEVRVVIEATFDNVFQQRQDENYSDSTYSINTFNAT